MHCDFESKLSSFAFFHEFSSTPFSFPTPVDICKELLNFNKARREHSFTELFLPCTDQLEFCKWNDETFHDAVDISTVLAASSEVQRSVCHAMTSQELLIAEDLNCLDGCVEMEEAAGDAAEMCCEEETMVEEVDENDDESHQSLENDDENESLGHETHETPPEFRHASRSFNGLTTNVHDECIDSAESTDSYDGTELKITMLGLSASSQSDSSCEPDNTTEAATRPDQQVDVRSCLLDFDKSSSDDEATTTIDESLTRAPELLNSADLNELLSQSRNNDVQSHEACHPSLPVENTPPLLNSDEFDKNSFAKLQKIFVTSVMKPASNNESRVEEEDDREVDLKCSISIQECRKAFAKLSGMMQGLGVSFIDDVSTPNPSSSRTLEENLSLIQEIPSSEARNDGDDEDKCCNASSCMNHRSSKTSLKSIRKTSTFTSAKDIFAKTMEARRKMISVGDENDVETGSEDSKLAWADSECILNEVVKQVFNFVDE